MHPQTYTYFNLNKLNDVIQLSKCRTFKMNYMHSLCLKVE